MIQSGFIVVTKCISPYLEADNWEGCASLFFSLIDVVKKISISASLTLILLESPSFNENDLLFSTKSSDFCFFLLQLKMDFWKNPVKWNLFAEMLRRGKTYCCLSPPLSSGWNWIVYARSKAFGKKEYTWSWDFSKESAWSIRFVLRFSEWRAEESLVILQSNSCSLQVLCQMLKIWAARIDRRSARNIRLRKGSDFSELLGRLLANRNFGESRCCLKKFKFPETSRILDSAGQRVESGFTWDCQKAKDSILQKRSAWKWLGKLRISKLFQIVGDSRFGFLKICRKVSDTSGQEAESVAFGFVDR